ncbi:MULTISPECIES: exopolysaccharide Pel transporter PelG [unclassified Paenibacillus]|uniref:exopolysaccharide Pel transporter PelG n=1 Tax=unclassified Paenibacillus TaxID=185978 RepID=UPI001C12145A|nr:MULTISPECIES: exopolysaccharide Pel transporter PelG [unclassified Paenibacillus]MBU5442410.1 exopolysaccharide Pel transporter PelG [Paenibacillus sp. MSJ-34]CAH0119446.1 hypothetical protein PAE9249_01949 [Paenibacillus sp. CECT 9249]
MAGVGFELRKLYEKEGVFNRLKAYVFSSVITVGPLCSCMLAVAAIQWMMIERGAHYNERELFFSGLVYAFVFSYIFHSAIGMLMTRTVSDMIYEQRYGEILPSVFGGLKILLPAAALGGGAFLIWSPLPVSYKLPLYINFMELIVIWHLTVYVSAIKRFKAVFYAFLTGMAVALAAAWGWLSWTNAPTAADMTLCLAGGWLITMLWLLGVVKESFRVRAQAPDFAWLQRARQYPSLIAAGLLGTLGLYSHQFVYWLTNGRWVQDAFLMTPEYDAAVFYAFLSITPTLVMFVVSLETNFYPKCREFYDSVLGQGSIADIESAHKDIGRMLTQELVLIMGIQLVCSIVAIALGIRLLPMVGFLSTQIETYTVLVMAFYAFVIYNVLSLVLLYFDDRKGVLALAGAFFAMIVVFSAGAALLQADPSFAVFCASSLSLLFALARLSYILKNLLYYTFSSQPLVMKQKGGITGETV